MSELHAESLGAAELPPPEPPTPTRRPSRPATHNPPMQTFEMDTDTELPASRVEGPLTPENTLTPDCNQPRTTFRPLAGLAPAQHDGLFRVPATPPPYDSHPRALPAPQRRPWDYEADQTQETITTTNASYEVDESFYLTGDYPFRRRSIPVDNLNFDRNSHYRPPLPLGDLEAAQRDGPSGTPAVPATHDRLDIFQPAARFWVERHTNMPGQTLDGRWQMGNRASMQSARDPRWLTMYREGPRLSERSYLPGDDAHFEERDDTRPGQTRNGRWLMGGQGIMQRANDSRWQVHHTTRRQTQRGRQKRRDGPSQLDPDDSIDSSGDWQTGSLLVRAHRALDPTWSPMPLRLPPPQTPQSAFSFSSSGGGSSGADGDIDGNHEDSDSCGDGNGDGDGNVDVDGDDDDDEAPCPEIFSYMPEEDENQDQNGAGGP